VIRSVASTHASVAGVALVVGLIAGGTFAIMEVQLWIRRTGTSSEPPPSRSEDPTTQGRLRRSWYIGTYGTWIKYWRILAVSVTVGALLVAAVAATLGYT
jgi:hypothetical protein